MTTFLQLGLGVGLVLIAGCARQDDGAAAASQAGAQSSAPAASFAVAEKVAAPSSGPAPQASQDRERFRQALVRKFDTSRMIAEPASPQGGVLHVPNGRAAHVMVAVRNADGTITGQCISSAAEAEALMAATSAGVEQ